MFVIEGGPLVLKSVILSKGESQVAPDCAEIRELALNGTENCASYVQMVAELKHLMSHVAMIMGQFYSRMLVSNKSS